MSRILSTICAAACAISLWGGVWQWSTPVRGIVSDETGRNPEAFLWIPETADSVKAVVFAFQNMNEETLFEMDCWRDSLAAMQIAQVWIAPGFGQEWDVTTGVQKALNDVLTDLAALSGYSEIATAPLIPFGHSAQATMPWNFAAWNPERTLCILSYHGDAPRTNLCGYGRANLEWGRTRNIDGIPGLMIEGEYEWWYARVRPALAFRMMYPGSCVSFLGDAGRGHFDVADRTAAYMACFVRKAMEQRLRPDGSLAKVDPAAGWLAEQWMPEQTRRAKPAPVAAYKGDPHTAFWYFDAEMARLTEERYAETRAKLPSFLNFEQMGQLLPYDENLHVRVKTRFIPEADGITFHLTPVFTDSTRNRRVDAHSSGVPTVKRICGPVKVINDTTFRVDFYRMGMDNPKRTWGIVLCAEAPGDSRYKEAVQQFEIKIPFRITNGRRQSILFPSIADRSVATDSLELKAVTDLQLPVSYYVKEGPVEIDGNVLRFTKLPPRAKFPVKVTVVAWQYGIDGLACTAEPVERSFYITKQ